MRVVFIRHATAEARGENAQGQKLTPRGIREAKTVAVALRNLGLVPQKVLTSPLLHAAETAAIIAHDWGPSASRRPPACCRPATSDASASGWPN